MLESFKRIFYRPERRRAATPAHQRALFILRYGTMEVGRLLHQEGRWYFEYSDGFKSQSEVRPLTDFPSLDKKYSSTELWPFFSVRIPGLGQPYVSNKIKEKGIDPENEIELLKQFGKTTISNPFELEWV